MQLANTPQAKSIHCKNIWTLQNHSNPARNVAMALKNALAFIAVRDIEAATRWYKMLLGREPGTQPMKGLAQ